MTSNLHQMLAEVLDNAMYNGHEIERLTAKHPDLNLNDAYLIQDEGIKLRLARREKLIGLKMGFTSEAKRQQMGLGLPIYGVLTDAMQVPAGATFELKGKIHPKIEPEIAFIIARELKGSVTHADVLESCSGVCAAMEILDSRFTGFKYFSLPDVVADNCSSSYFVLSKQIHNPRTVDLSNLKMEMEIDGNVVQSAQSSAISGHPINSIIQLCELLDSRGLSLPAGTIVLAGAATAAVQMTSGMKVRTRVESLGEVEISVL